MPMHTQVRKRAYRWTCDDIDENIDGDIDGNIGDSTDHDIDGETDDEIDDYMQRVAIPPFISPARALWVQTRKMVLSIRSC